MKKIKFTEYKKADPNSIFKRDKFHSVFIKRGLTIGFKSETKMKAWLNESSQFFTFKMYQYIQIFSNVQKLYWDNWLYFSTNANRNEKNRYLAGLNIDQNCQLIAKSLNRLEIEAKHGTGVHYVFMRLNSLKNMVDEICDVLSEEIPAVNTSVHYRVKTHKSELQLWQNQLDKFGLMDTAKIEDAELAEPIPILKKVI